ncbi:glycosyltransferase family 2 protein [Ferruginibacter albus]|nr:glycosyltransferase family 2 protein [Ferruginibacter albus]
MRLNDVEALTAAGTKDPAVAIVILNWNGKHFLQQFLPSVLATTYNNKRIIVADNASTDDSVSFLQQNFPSVEIIQNSSNEGFAKGYNTALKQVQSDYYVLLNSDVEVTPDWIEPIIELMKNDATIAVCQPKILSFANKNEFEYAGACGGWIDNLGYPFAVGRIFDAVEKDNGQYNAVRPCFWASGAAFFVKANVYHELNGLDDFLFAHQEEIDFCWRAQSAGYKIYVQPNSIVYHVGGGTLPTGNNRKVFLNFRNNLILLAKNLSFGNAVWKIPFRFLLDWLAAVMELLKGNGGYFIAVIKAHFHFISWRLFHKKRSVFTKINNRNLEGVYKGSIVWQYFIKKKSTFSEIVGNK